MLNFLFFKRKFVIYIDTTQKKLWGKDKDYWDIPAYVAVYDDNNENNIILPLGEFKGNAALLRYVDNDML